MAFDPRLGPLAYAHYLFACQFFEQIAADEKNRLRGQDKERLSAIRRSSQYALAYIEEEPLVSVIIPTYNRGKTILERTYPCLAAQEYRNLEIIIVGDQMDEENAQLLNSIKDPRVSFYNLKRRGRYPERQGPRWYTAGIKPMNFGLRVAKGRWIAHLDDDDEFYPIHIGELLAKARAEQAEWAHSQILYVDDNGNPTSVVGDEIPDLGKISRISSIYHAGLKTFRYNPACWRYFSPGDWDLWERFLEMGVTHTHLAKVTGIHHGNLNRIMELTTEAEKDDGSAAKGTDEASGTVETNRDLARIDRHLGAKDDKAKLKAEADSLKIYRHQRYYKAWMERHTLQEIDAELMAERMVKKWNLRPQFLILMTCSRSELPKLNRTIESLQKQFYQNWRLIIISDLPSPSPIFEQTDALGWLQLESLEDDAVLNNALNQVAQAIPSDWICLLPAGTEFDSNWMITTGDYINLNPRWAAIYTDDDLVAPTGARTSPRMKPDFNLDYLRSMDYVGSSCWFRTEHLLGTGGFGPFPGAQHFEFLFRLFDISGPGAIGHIAEPLVHYPLDKPVHPLMEAAAHAALEAHFQRSGIAADIEPGYAADTRRIVYRHETQPPVSIIVPNRDSYGYLKPCIESIFEKTDYPAFEVIVVDNQSSDPDVLRYYEEAAQRHAGRFKVVYYDQPFNFSAQCNLGVEVAAGEYILLLNNDTEIVQPTWLSRMMQYGQRPDVGIVGARLVYPEDGGIQHAGVVLGAEKLAAHPFQGHSLDDPGYMNRLHVDQNYSAVTAACLLIRRSVYSEVGGMNPETLPVLFNDVDLCLKAGQLGYRIIWTPYATVVHLESKSLKSDAFQESHQKTTERDQKSARYMHTTWRKLIANDPAYNRHLALSRGGFSVEPVLVADWDTNFHDRPRVLAFPPAGGVGEYRFYAPLRGLSMQARVQSTVVQTEKYHQTRYPTLPELNRLDPDTLMRQVSFDQLDLEWLKWYRDHRPDILYVYMMDDLITEIPRGNPNFKHVPRDSRFRLRQLLAHVDRLIVSTEPLLDLAKDMIEDVRVLPNRLRDDLWLPLRSERRTSPRPRIGWAGAQQHGGDLALIVDLVKETANEADWIFFGMCPDELRPYVREYHEFEVGVEAYPAKLASLNLDLAVAPLEINAFNEAKSNLRILEYGVLGLPVVCTDVFPFRTDNPPVKRVRNDSGAWIEAVRERVHDLDAAAREGDALKDWVLKNYMLSNHLDAWHQALTERRC